MLPGAQILREGQQLFAGTFKAIQDEARALRVGDLVNKSSGLTAREKSFVFNYMREGDIPEHLRIHGNQDTNLRIYEPIPEFQRNVIMLVESFFLYSFKPRTDNILAGGYKFSASFAQKVTGENQWDDADY